MRVNIYAEELSDDVRVVTTTADTGRIYSGVRIFMHSTDRLHHSDSDDDRSAVTLWGEKKKLIALLEKAKSEIEHA
jgi:hypothetical protein